MKTIVRALALTSPLLLAVPVQAGKELFDDVYIGSNFSLVNYEQDSYAATPLALSVKVGSRLNRYFAIEGVAGMGIYDGKQTYGGVKFPTRVESLLAGNLKVIAPLKRNFEAYGIVGLTHLVLETDISGGLGDSESVVSWGIGASYALSKNFVLNVEYLDVDDAADPSGYTDYQIDMFNFGFEYHF